MVVAPFLRAISKEWTFQQAPRRSLALTKKKMPSGERCPETFLLFLPPPCLTDPTFPADFLRHRGDKDGRSFRPGEICVVTPSPPTLGGGVPSFPRNLYESLLPRNKDGIFFPCPARRGGVPRSRSVFRSEGGRTRFLVGQGRFFFLRLADSPSLP